MNEICPCWRRPWNPLDPFAHRDDCHVYRNACQGCGKPILKANLTMSDGCPCNSPRGVNHGLVPKSTCACDACDRGRSPSIESEKREHDVLAAARVVTKHWKNHDFYDHSVAGGLEEALDVLSAAVGKLPP